MKSLPAEIASWDAKNVAEIKEIYQRYRSDSDFAAQLISFFDSAELEVGATWLLKHYLEQGGTLTKTEVARLHRSFKHLQHWSAKLHVLQCAEYWLVPKRYQQSTLAFIRSCLDHQRPFVRANAHHSFFWFANQFPEFREEVLQGFDNASTQETASVQARIRNLRKRGFDEATERT